MKAVTFDDKLKLDNNYPKPTVKDDEVLIENMKKNLLFQEMQAFSVGLTIIEKDGYAFVTATPEKVLCNLIANSIGVNLRYRKDAGIYLEEDIRMELEDFRRMNAGRDI